MVDNPSVNRKRATRTIDYTVTPTVASKGNLVADAEALSNTLAGRLAIALNLVTDGLHSFHVITPDFDEITLRFVRKNDDIVFANDYNEFLVRVVARLLLVDESLLVLKSHKITPHSKNSAVEIDFCSSVTIRSWLITDFGERMVALDKHMARKAFRHYEAFVSLSGSKTKFENSWNVS